MLYRKEPGGLELNKLQTTGKHGQLVSKYLPNHLRRLLMHFCKISERTDRGNIKGHLAFRDRPFAISGKITKTESTCEFNALVTGNCPVASIEAKLFSSSIVGFFRYKAKNEFGSDCSNDSCFFMRLKAQKQTLQIPKDGVDSNQFTEST